jgi:hypothetical protein
VKVLAIGRGRWLDVVTSELGARGSEVTVLDSSGSGVVGSGAAVLQRPAELAGRLDVILGAVRGRSGEIGWDDPAWALIDAVAACDAVVIAGEAALAPGLIHESLLLTRLATSFGKAVVLSGQTLRPSAPGDDRADVTEIVCSAVLIGLCDDASLDVARDLGVAGDALRRTIDAAAFAPPLTATDGGWRADGPFALVDLVSLAPFDGGSSAQALAGLLDEGAKLAGAELIAVGPSDRESSIVDSLLSPCRLVEVSAARVDQLARTAAFVVSGDPDVCQIAAASGVPVMAISISDDIDRLLRRRLGDFGLSGAVLPAAAVASGDASEALERIVHDADGRAPARLIEMRMAEATAWWDEVHATLRGESAPAAVSPGVPQAELLSESSQRRVSVYRELQSAVTLKFEGDAARITSYVDELAAAEARLAALDQQLGELAAERDAARSELSETELALRAAHTAAIELEARLSGAERMPKPTLESTVRRAEVGAVRARMKLRRLVGRGLRAVRR